MLTYTISLSRTLIQLASLAALPEEASITRMLACMLEANAHEYFPPPPSRTGLRASFSASHLSLLDGKDLLLICHFPQQSPIISGSFAKKDLPLKTSSMGLCHPVLLGFVMSFCY